MVYMIESQIAHVLAAIRAMGEEKAETAEVRPGVAASFNDRIESQMEATVWNTGCSSWYLDSTGRNATLWPDWTFLFRRRAAEFDPAAYVLDAGVPSTRIGAISPSFGPGLG